MQLSDARVLAHDLLQTHNLEPDWSFRFDHAKRRFGCCNYTKKEISLSKHLTQLNSKEQVTETLLHEIAHALTPGDHHGKKWQAKCLELGITAERCYKLQDVTTPQANFLLVCPNCNLEVPRMRRSRTKYVCRACCKRYNNGKPSSKYQLEWRLA